MVTTVSRSLSTDMDIIVGLGNPGLRYKNTRHNAGFMLIKALAKKYNVALRKKGFGGVYGIGRISGREVMLFEPLTYMNLSGPAVKAVVRAKMSEEDRLLVISDDFCLPLGTLRFREKGSAGGHNGLKSIIEQIGPDFSRLRLGVGGEYEAGDKAIYVLSPFPRKEKSLLKEELDRAVEGVEIWLMHGIKEAMNRHN